MKKYVAMFLLVTAAGICFAEEAGEAEDRVDLSFYASTRGEMQVNFMPQWKFPFLRGKSPLTDGNSIVLKLDAALSPISAGLSGDAVLTVFPFLSFTAGAMAGTGWNYDLFGKVPLAGLGLNRRTGVDDPDDGVIGNGFDGAVWDVHAGTAVQFDLAALVPGDWNHVVMRLYNKIDYLAYTKAEGDDLWYYLGDDGMNMNAARHSFELFAGYAPPLFADLIGYQLSGTLPFYNTEAGNGARDRGYSLAHACIVNFKINRNWSIMTIARVTNRLKNPVTRDYEREWGFDRAQFIAAWRVK
ncbi:MAG: hypothetical protein LBL31_05125 [Spirochaetaceae bacterium]|jgi:hypothetical protein|nr:hypothetical protein [Spirochaetaceae bacterium]